MLVKPEKNLRRTFEEFEGEVEKKQQSVQKVTVHDLTIVKKLNEIRDD